MRKLSAFICFLFAVKSSFAQLNIKPTTSGHDTYVYVKGAVLFVNQEVNLQKNADASLSEASIYLREEAQLIQGDTENSRNTGNGLLSVFQEGTSNAYDYNYWSSPVGIGSSGNGNFGINMLYSPRNQTHSVRAEATSELDGISDPLKVSSTWIHTYSGNLYANWYPIQNRTEIPAGYGFIMKGVNGTDFNLVDGKPNNPGNAQRYDFRGLPNNGPIKIPIAPEENILVGNPFPSALDLSLFLLENSGTGTFDSECYGSIARNNKITGIAYFWDSIENGSSHYLQDYVGGYGAFSPVDPCTTGIYEKPIFKSYGNTEVPSNLYGKHYERRYLPIAQGFMVEGASVSELEFKNTHRIFKKEGQNSDFKKPALELKEELKVIPKIRLEITFNDTYTRHLSLGFWPSATSGTDNAMDAQIFDLAPTDIGWLHQEEAFIIDVRPFDNFEEIPFFLKVENSLANIKIQLVETENFDLKELFIFDSESNAHYPLMDHYFQVVLDPEVYHGRFYLKFREDPVALPAPVIVDSDLDIFQNNALNQFEIRNPSQIPIQMILIYDLSGKQILSNFQIPSDNFAVSTAILAEGVYIVKVLMADQTEIIKRFTKRNIR